MSTLDTLLKTPPAELVGDLKGIREERAALESKEAVLEQLLEMMSRQGGEIAQEIAALGASVAIGPLRGQIVQVLKSLAEDDLLTVMPQGVQEALVERGNRRVTLDNVRVTMKRMAESGEIEKPVPEQAMLYALPGTAQRFPTRMADLGEFLAGQR